MVNNYVDPGLGKVRVERYSEPWLQRRCRSEYEHALPLGKPNVDPAPELPVGADNARPERHAAMTR